VLEQLGDAKEQRRGFVRAECLSDIEQVHDPGQERPTFTRRDRRLVEAPSFLQDRRLVMIERCPVSSFQDSTRIKLHVPTAPASSSFLNDMLARLMVRYPELNKLQLGSTVYSACWRSGYDADLSRRVSALRRYTA
jgi:hypothetical protein